MKLQFCLVWCLILISLVMQGQDQAPAQSNTFDIVWLRDGSKLKGTILSWELGKQMEFKLITGAIISIDRESIQKVTQDSPVVEERVRYVKEPEPYAFRETGWYHNTSGFLNVSQLGGAGVSHAMGYRFSRLFGLGAGVGIETNDFNRSRRIMPVFVEARGFLLPVKISPYYALKIGYGLALRDMDSGTIQARGGVHVSPEFGVRFGHSDVAYYLGIEYKIQNARFTTNEWWQGGTSTEMISYRRMEWRMGLLF